LGGTAHRGVAPLLAPGRCPYLDRLRRPGTGAVQFDRACPRRQPVPGRGRFGRVESERATAPGAERRGRRRWAASRLRKRCNAAQESVRFNPGATGARDKPNMRQYTRILKIKATGSATTAAASTSFREPT